MQVERTQLSTFSFQLSTFSKYFVEEFRCINFRVYKDAKDFLIVLNSFANKLPYYMADQINRAALSIVLNIAEGSGKKSDKDFNRYIQNSLGSVHEVFAVLDIAHDMRLLSDNDFIRLTNKLSDIRRQLGGLSKKLKADS